MPLWNVNFGRSEEEVDEDDLDYVDMDEAEVDRQAEKGPRLRVRQTLPQTAYLSDGRKLIDFVLAFHPDAGGKERVERAQFRRKFEAALKAEGLLLEYEGKERSPDGRERNSNFLCFNSGGRDSSLNRRRKFLKLAPPIGPLCPMKCAQTDVPDRHKEQAVSKKSNFVRLV